jgi:DNA-binding transcriptional regulator GbsR (MarR family)
LNYGCDSQGPAEKAGEKIDQSIENTKDAVEQVTDTITGKGPAEELGEKIDETIEKIEESTDSQK